MPEHRGRPPRGPDLVDRLDDCSELARLRLKVILQTIAGSTRIDDACVKLGIERSAFNKLRAAFVADAVRLLEPRKPGRKKKVLTQEQVEFERLRKDNARLTFELQAQQLREEIGILMPHLLKPSSSSASSGRKKKRRGSGEHNRTGA